MIHAPMESFGYASVMRTTLVRVIVLLLFPLATLAQSQWTPFVVSEGHFKVLLPGKPGQTATSPPTFSLSSNSGIYVMSYTDGHEGGE